MTAFQIKRIYDESSNSDGYRVLVDRLWPRGVSKEWAQLDGWSKDLAPSPGLRSWFSHKPERFTEFTVRYQNELSQNTAVHDFLIQCTDKKTVTLLYAARDPKINHAVVLQAFLKNTT